MRSRTLVCVFALFVGAVLQGRALSPTEKRADFEQLASMIRSHYAPLELKTKKFQLDLDAMVETYSTQAASMNNLEFFHSINKFISEFQDSHFRGNVQTDYVSHLGFICDRIAGSVLVEVSADYRLQKGDEILEIDGKPVADAVKDLAKYIGMGNPETALRLASMMIAYRPAALVPGGTGTSKVKFRKGASAIVETIDMDWRTAGNLDEDALLTWGSIAPRNYENLSIADIYNFLPEAERGFHCSGLTRTAPPKDTKVLIASPFVAYYHPTPKGNVGYLRIPHYSWGKDAEVRFQQYEWAIEQLEKNTVGLIIDQDHNCGGSVFFLEDMVGLFADKPYKGLEFQFLSSRAEYLDFKGWVEGDARFTTQGADWLEVISLVKQAWLSRSRLSAKTTFHANRVLQPRGVRYTKPILMLIDEMSGSGGDAFPAMMKGMGRAKLMGTRTMGAGGHVVEMPRLNNSSHILRMTKSLFYRVDGVPVENNGVDPDVVYQPTRNDFMYQYREYQKRYLEELDKLIP